MLMDRNGNRNLEQEPLIHASCTAQASAFKHDDPGESISHVGLLQLSGTVTECACKAMACGSRNGGGRLPEINLEHLTLMSFKPRK